jgi:hypothetical protein
MKLRLVNSVMGLTRRTVMEYTHSSNTYFPMSYEILALKLSVSITTNIEPQILIFALGVQLLQVQTRCRPS